MKNTKKLLPTQAERFIEQLSTIKVDVTSADRKQAVKDLGVSGPTITNYLNGKVSDLDTASAILLYFRSRIAKREKELAA